MGAFLAQVSQLELSKLAASPDRREDNMKVV
jgi:hypothetical protein